MSDLRSLTEILSPMLPYLLITLSVWIAYIYAVTKCGFVSDDLAGILDYDGKLQSLEYGTISRWLRYHIAGGNFPSKHRLPNKPDGKPGDFIPQGKIPVRHHILIIIVFNIACLLTYSFLKNIVGAKLAFLTVILFAVHPCCVQAVAWCSGLGYSLSLFWIASMLNLTQWFYAHQSLENCVITTLGLCFFQFMGIHAQVIPMMTFAILMFLGHWPFAILCLLVSAAMNFDIIKQTVEFRKTEFKKQKLDAGTSIKPRKFIVAMKTLLYYLGLTLVPRKMGLYHKWGFHYDSNIEREDKLFILGLVGLIGLIGLFFLYPAIPVKLGILWFLAFSVIFLNWITIQQFVTERYIMIPSIGTCLIISYFTQDYLWIWSFIAGLYLCRTWLHLPTYDNELRFYLSNIWNFPDSEVAYGNLGVTYMRGGMMGSGMDAWMTGTLINPDYDVPYYNIFSTYKGQAMMSLQNGDYQGAIVQLKQAYPWLEKTLACKTCHFPDLWKKEQTELLEMIKNPANTFRSELMRLLKLDMDLKTRLSKASSDKEKNDVNISLNNNSVQLSRIIEYMKQNNIPINPPIGTEADLLRRLTQPIHYIRR